jgi:hypothetical protein
MRNLTRLQAVETTFRVVSSPSLWEFDCPFCGKTEVSMFIGKVSFSATMGGESLCEPVKPTLVALICADSHLFFVLESDMAAMCKAAAA